MPTMVREAWTDERLDNLENRVDEGFREVRADLRKQRERINEVVIKQERMEAKFEAKFDAVDARLEAMNRTLQIGFGLIGAVLTGILGMFATQL
jgi:uncharacterized coiled-coil protein SlyX